MADCTPSVLVADTVSFVSVSNKQELAIQAYLLANIAGTSTDPTTLVSLSKCFECLSEKQLLSIQAYLLCQITGGA